MRDPKITMLSKLWVNVQSNERKIERARKRDIETKNERKANKIYTNDRANKRLKQLRAFANIYDFWRVGVKLNTFYILQSI